MARLPQGMAPLAVLLLVRGATNSYAAAGLAVGGSAFATAACAPLLGRLVDALGPRRVLAPLAAGRGDPVLPARGRRRRADAGAAVLIVLAALAGALLPPVAPVGPGRCCARCSTIRTSRDTAYALEAVIQEVLWVTGPLFVALVVAVGSPAVAVRVLGGGLPRRDLAVPALAAALAVARARHRTAPSAARRWPAPSCERCSRPVALTGAGLGAIEVGLPSLALHAGSRPASGLLLALWSVGSMAGGLWYGARVWRSPLARRYRVLLGLAVLCTAPLIAARSIAAGVVCSLLAGVTIAPVFSCQYALVGRSVSAGSETEAFTWVSAALIGGLAAGSAIGGAVIGPGGVECAVRGLVPGHDARRAARGRLAAPPRRGSRPRPAPWAPRRAREPSARRPA